MVNQILYWAVISGLDVDNNEQPKIENGLNGNKEKLQSIADLLGSRHKEVVKQALNQLTDALSDSKNIPILNEMGVLNQLDLLSYIDEEMETKVNSLISILSTEHSEASNKPLELRFHRGDEESMLILMKEMTFIDGELGYKVWTSSQVMVRELIKRKINFKGKRVLEVGCGTGLVGIACAMLDAKEVYLTDYHENVINNAALNIELNECANAHAGKLDWYEVASGRIQPPEQPWDIVIGTDFVYDNKVPFAFPSVLKTHLSIEEDSCFYCVLPGPEHRYGVVELENQIQLLGMTMEKIGPYIQNDGKTDLTHFFYIFKWLTKI